ncbi:hypothetical protein OH76DRAFT_389306 [Lentinus brumalis]|uniref:Uncharacterized protein n=1 Tax=Lentinus brumalis TaxID=2498619 RepID=A0A371DV97_9APHY|nr:hypothetical protein OH76DRAFT_389306 [Polyporus brumalis]
MTRSASTIWRRARENVPGGLPDCPKDMSEPAYTNLMFDPHCHFCVKARVMKIMWACRVRCCKSCFKDNFVEIVEVWKACHLKYDEIRPGAMLPAEAVNNKLYFLKRDITKLIEQLDALNGDADAIKNFEAERMQAIEELDDSVDVFEAWSTAAKHRRQEERTQLIRRREEQILERLRQSGFDDMTEPELRKRISLHPLAQQPKELTDRIWNNIKEPIIAWAEGGRAELRMHRHCQQYTNRLRVLRDYLKDFYTLHHYPEVVPSVADFSWYTPTFRQIMGKGHDEVLNHWATHRDDFFKTVEVVVEIWRRIMARRLYGMIPPEVRPPLIKPHKHQHRGANNPEANEVAGKDDIGPADEHILRALHASVTWFRCTVNGCLLDYPRVLAHECAKAGPPINLHPETEMDALQNAYNIMLNEFPWNFTGDKIVYDVNAHQAAEKIVRVTLTNTNAVPDLTDKFWLDNLDERYVCGQCSKGGLLCVMPWRVAVKHLSDADHRGKDVKLTVLNVEDRSDVLDREARLADINGGCYKMWGCIRYGCRTPAMNLAEMIDHSFIRYVPPQREYFSTR